MAAEHDPTEFIDDDFQAGKAAYTTTTTAAAGAPAQRAPSREEVDTRVIETQQKLAELKRAQEELERERAGLEETRRRHLEFQTGRQEMLQNLTRGVALLEDAEFAARRDAEQMSRTLIDLRAGLQKVQGIQEETWTKENFPTELTRALTAVENARMEWNSARLKFPVLTNAPVPATGGDGSEVEGGPALLAGKDFGDLCRIGFALTWPVALAVLIAAALLLVLRH